MLIDGKLVDSVSGETFTVSNPATEETIAEAPRARLEDAERAARAAHTAHPDWRFTPGLKSANCFTPLRTTPARIGKSLQDS